jgi:flagellin-specific chaperone FliS
MVMRLVAANLNNDVAILDEVAGLLTELKGAWDSIRPSVTASAAASPQQQGKVMPDTSQQPKPVNKVQLAYGKA